MSDIIDWEKTAFEVARNHVGPRLPPEELIRNLGLTEHDFESLCEDELFKRKVRDFTKELTENGTSFALKAQVQAEELLKTQFRIARDPDTPAATAITAIANTVRWAGFDKRPDAGGEDSGANRPKISISINLSSPTATPTITDTTTTVTPLVIDATPS